MTTDNFIKDDIDAAQKIALAGMKGGYEIAKRESLPLVAEIERLRALNTELVRILLDIEKHLSGGAALHSGSLIFEEDSPAIDVIRTALAKAASCA